MKKKGYAIGWGYIIGLILFLLLAALLIFIVFRGNFTLQGMVEQIGQLFGA